MQVFCVFVNRKLYCCRKQTFLSVLLIRVEFPQITHRLSTLTAQQISVRMSSDGKWGAVILRLVLSTLSFKK